MRIKTFTLMTLALLVSAVSFAQKPAQDRQAQAFDRQALAPQFGFQKGVKPQRPSVQTDGEFSHQVTMSTVNFAAEVVTPPADSEPEYFTASGTHSRQSSGPLERTVKVFWDGDDVYISGLSYFVPDAFVKGTFVDDETVVFAKDQFLGTYAFSDGTAELYFGAYNTETRASDNATVTYDGEANKFTFSGIIAEFYSLDGQSGLTGYWRDLTVTKIEGEVDLPVEIPNDMEYEKYTFVGINPWADEGEDPNISRNVNVGFYGNEVYIQGVCSILPEAWIKGEFDEDGDIVFPSGQLLGNYRNVYDLYFIGYTSSGIVDVWFEYDKEAGKLTCHVPYAINIYKNEVNRSVFEYYSDVVISKIVEKAATPATPKINNLGFYTYGDALEYELAVVDTEGDGLLTSKLSYQLYSEDAAGNQNVVTFTQDLYPNLETASLTEIPATFADNYDFDNGEVWLNMDHDNWVKIGLKTIYRGGNEEHESAIAWYTITQPQSITLPEGAKVTKHDLEGKIYEDKDYATQVNLAIVGDDLYIQGLSDSFPEAWVKGTKNAEGDYVFANGQELGTYSSYRMFLIGYGDIVTDAVLSADLLSGVYKFETEFVVNAAYTDRLYYMDRILAGTTIKIDGVDTGIKTLKTINANGAALYNLAGQRVSDGFKGLVIKDGKKFINK